MSFTRTEELEGYFGDDFSKKIISHKGYNWYVKQKNESEKKIDLLAYYLGKNWTNIAEVIELDKEAKTIITNNNIFTHFDNTNTWLVKIGQSYPTNQICIKNIDKAVATELIFSLWTRRRDTHSYNRVYSDKFNVPIFFDHQTAFLGEQDLQDIKVFFDPNQNGAGYASTWRIRTKDNQLLTTKYVRDYEKKSEYPLTIHFVNDIQNTLYYIRETVDLILSNNFENTDIIKKAGFKNNEADEILSFIKKNKNELLEDSIRMMEIITK